MLANPETILEQGQLLLRPPEQVMRLDRMGSMFQTRLSFMRSLIRRMSLENWRFERPHFDLNGEGFGAAVYSVSTADRTYSLVAFSNDLDPGARTDRVIAEAWDATFNLFDGVPTRDDIERLRDNTPRQEAGRFSASELTLARANKSLRLFQDVTEWLADGEQPDATRIAQVGYLMRTTAVYGSGKFGCADRAKIAGRSEMRGSFQAEMITVYLIRLFTIDLVEHVARMKGGDRAVRLDPAIRRYLGIGNATGLGMAPFLVSHQELLHDWVVAREEALARVRALPHVDADQIAHLQATTAQAQAHISEWRVGDATQSARIVTLEAELPLIAERLHDVATFSGDFPLDALYRWGEGQFSLEAQELLVSLLLEPFAELVDDLAEGLATEGGKESWNPMMPIGELRALLSNHYAWALNNDYAAPQESRRFWYYSEEKLEPRLGDRTQEAGEQFEMPLTSGRDAWLLQRDLDGIDDSALVADFVITHPQHRHIVRRVQTAAHCPYGEINDNVIADDFRPIDMLRFKLAFFGASKFDPKSDLWTRIVMYQGAPFPDELDGPLVDDWIYALKPVVPP